MNLLPTHILTMESFDRIHLNISKLSGRCRITDKGLGWKPSGEGETFTLDKDDVASATWSRAAKGHEVRIHPRSSSNVIRLDGFDQEDFDRAAKAFRLFYGVTLEPKEHALRGYNWGKGEFGKGELTFNVQNRPAFEIPYTEITNANQAGKNEVAVEFKTGGGGNEKENGVNGTSKGDGKKAAGAVADDLVEMRFYIPGTVTTGGGGKAEDGEQEEDDTEEQNAAALFYESIMNLANIGDVAGDTFATFLDVLHLTPRWVPFKVCPCGRPELMRGIAEVVSTSTCTRTRSVSAARRTTTRSSTSISRSSCYCQNRTIFTHLSSSVWSRHCVKVKPDTLFW